VSDRRYRPTGGEPGEVTVYNNTGAKITLTKDGDIIASPRRVVTSSSDGAAALATRREALRVPIDGHATAGGPVSPPMVAPARRQRGGHVPGNDRVQGEVNRSLCRFAPDWGDLTLRARADP
jgi:phage gp45-like